MADHSLAKEDPGTLAQWLRQIEQAHPLEIELGLDRVRAVYERLGLSRIATRQIVVAGTNGKGSTVALIEQGAKALGLRVGSYTSPHLHRYNERIRINAVPLDDQTIVASFERVERARGDIPLTYFEFGTLSALLALSESELDLCVLEIGLGGRLDAVNIVDADLSIITSIGLDHMDWLGDNISAIAREKAGIMRRGKPVLVGETCPDDLEALATESGAQLLRFGREFFLDETALVTESGQEYAIPNEGLPDLPNNNIALALRALLWCLAGSLSRVSLEAITKAWLAAPIPGRFEQINYQSVAVLLDVGHNPQAAQYLAGKLSQQRQQGRAVFAVYSCLADKDAAGVMDAMKQTVDRWYVAPLSCARAMDPAKLEAAMKDALGDGDSHVTWHEGITAALASAVAHAQGAEAVVIAFGSFAVVEEARNYLGAS